MDEIKKINPKSLAKICMLLAATLGLIVGISAAIIGIGYSENVDLPVDLGAAEGIFSIIIMPLTYGLFGYLFGLIIAALYNLYAKKFGGIKVLLN